MNWYKKAKNTTSDQFKDWFGDWTNEDAYSSKSKNPIPSMAVDKDQNPQVMYHGTLKNFDDFEVGQEGYNSNVFGSWKTTRNAIFFTPDPNHANAFTSSGGETNGGNIKPVYLNVRSPLDFRNGVDDFILDEFEKEGINPRWLINFNWEHLDDEDGKLLVDAAKRLGYDGIMFIDQNPETKEDMETWAVFDPSQIHSIYKSFGTINWYKKAKFGDPIPHNDELQALVESLKGKYPGLDLYAYVTEGYVEIAQIVVPPENRNQGIGTEVIQAIKNFAQPMNLPVVVRPEAESRKKKKLDNFYKGLDFVHNKGRKKDYQLSTPFAPTMYWKPPVPNQDNP